MQDMSHSRTFQGFLQLLLLCLHDRLRCQCLLQVSARDSLELGRRLLVLGLQICDGTRGKDKDQSKCAAYVLFYHERDADTFAHKTE